jgi:probable 2-oxoglutarate dehydrogenase E1 component DHKTD1
MSYIGYPLDVLRYIGAVSVKVPDELNVHPRLLKSHLEPRIRQLEKGVGVDWATAEALAIGSLLLNGNIITVKAMQTVIITHTQYIYVHIMLACLIFDPFQLMQDTAVAPVTESYSP